MTKRPLVPLARPRFGKEEEELLLATLRSGWVTQGPRVAEFEQRFAERVGAAHAVAVSSCTTALFLSLHAHGLGPGDEVIAPSLTYIASVNPILHVGATPVLVDVDPRTYNLDPEQAEAALGERTRAILPVHQLGMPADLDAFRRLAGERGLVVIEDAACAVGARRDGREVGDSGDDCCFSFHPRKVLVTGEGGMIALGDAERAARLRRLRHQGMGVSDVERHAAERVITERYDEVGYNFRMSDLQAAVGLAQLDRLDALLARRRELAAAYDAAFAGHALLEPPYVPPGAEPNYQSYIVRLRGAERARRDAFMDAMRRRGIATRRGLMAVHLERPYRDGAARRHGSLRHSEEADAQTVVLPLFADLSEAEQGRVIEAVDPSLAEAGLA